MSVVPIQRMTRASAVAEVLREELLSGTIAPGTALRDVGLDPGDGRLSPLVRAALAELADDGLIVHSLQTGPQVRPISRGDVQDVYAARRVYETAGLQALMGASVLDVSWLAAAAERMGEAAVEGDVRAAVEADMAFHLGLVAAAGSSRLTRAARAALMELRLILPVADRLAGDLPALAADHQQLVAVLREGSVAAAVAALHEHLYRGEWLVLDVADEDRLEL